MKKRRFIQCDVFTATPIKGNGLAVVIDAEGLTDQQMQDFAAWTNLAETTFLFPSTDPSADYKVRIFSPGREMPFAGHPTLGSCASWLHSGGTPQDQSVIRQECNVGIVEIDMTSTFPAFIAPPTSIEKLPEDDLKKLTHALDLNPQKVINNVKLDNGPVWQVLELETAEQVLAVDSLKVRWPQFRTVGLIGAHEPGSDYDYEVRMLAPSSGMSEDPVTGSLNSALAHWLYAQGRLHKELVVAQGTSINRHGRVYIKPDSNVGSRILIGGQTHIVIEGTITI